ncbi:MAG: ABC transporter permease [Rhodobacteraceae bacterium]|nr:ABC transporter permease [Paracoccaceae bacterium]
MTDGDRPRSDGAPPTGRVPALVSPWVIVSRHFELIRALVERDIESRIRGTVLGKVWIVFGPLFMLAVYTLVFGLILNSRWQDRTDDAFLFPLIYFSGLVLFNFFFESISRATTLLRDNQSFITKIVFPLEAFCYSVVGSSLVRFAIGFVILGVFYLPLQGLPPLAALAYPLLFLGLALFAVGGTLALAALAVYLRDLAHLMQPLSMLLLFLSPLFYPLDRVPEAFRPLVMLNPLAYPLEATRNALFFGEWPNPLGAGLYLVLGWVSAAAGYALFMRLRAGFADVV